jgi:hypothetical protein
LWRTDEVWSFGVYDSPLDKRDPVKQGYVRWRSGSARGHIVTLSRPAPMRVPEGTVMYRPRLRKPASDMDDIEIPAFLRKQAD